MFAVIFEVNPRRERWDAYLGYAKMLRPELEQIDGFIENELAIETDLDAVVTAGGERDRADPVGGGRGAPRRGAVAATRREHEARGCRRRSEAQACSLPPWPHAASSPFPPLGCMHVMHMRYVSVNGGHN